MGPKNKECTSLDGTVDESEPLGQFSNPFFSNMCASRIEMLKMFLLCFEPHPLLQKRSKASVCIHAKARGSFLL